MHTPDWQTTFDAELQRARSARAAGNEGMARVCARRAASAAIREYLQRRGAPAAATSVYDLCRVLRGLPDVPPAVITTADHLLIRVDETHNLPPGVDLIEEAAGLPAGLGLVQPHPTPSPRGAAMTPTNPPEITVYGATDCDDTARSRDLLERHGVAYRYVNIDHDPAAEAFVIQHNGGFRSTPTIVFADGSHLVEPSDEALARKLGLEQ